MCARKDARQPQPNIINQDWFQVTANAISCKASFYSSTDTPNKLPYGSIWSHHVHVPPVLATFRDIGGCEMGSKMRPSMSRVAGSICSGKEHKTCNMKASRTAKTNLSTEGNRSVQSFQDWLTYLQARTPTNINIACCMICCMCSFPVMFHLVFCPVLILFVRSACVPGLA